MQERLLSRRVLHFGLQQIYWECHELDACETFPGGLPPAILQQQSMRTGFKNIGSMNNPESRLYPQWERVTRAYTQGGLTKTSDKIIALAGIAAEIQSILNDDYLAGLWRQYLAEQLVWQVVGERTSRSSFYRAPSWSWLSIDGPIEPSTAFNSPVLIEILSADIETPPGYELSHIKSGSICLRGILTRATWQYTPSIGPAKTRLSLLFDDRALDYVGISPDDHKETLPETVFCLPVIPQRYQGDINVEGLLLHSVGDKHYQRLGYFRAIGREVCEVIEQAPRANASDRAYDSHLCRHLPTMVLTLV